MKSKVVHSKLAKDLVKDPSAPPDLVRFVGRTGPSNDTTMLRIYQDDDDLRSFIEVREEDVVRTEPVAEGSDRTAVWIHAEANVRLVSVMTASGLRTRRLTLSQETLRTLTFPQLWRPGDTTLPPPVSDQCTYGRCTSADSCSLAPCCGSGKNC